MYKMVKIELGDTVKCIYTGLTGIVVSELRFINKCVQFEIAGKVGKDNRPTEGIYIDSQSLKIIKRGKEGKAADKDKAIEDKKNKEDDKGFTGGPNNKHIRMAGH